MSRKKNDKLITKGKRYRHSSRQHAVNSYVNPKNTNKGNIEIEFFYKGKHGKISLASVKIELP